MLLDLKNIDEVLDIGRRTDLAGMIATGFNEPQKLKEYEQRFQRLAGMTVDRQKIIERALKMHAAIADAKVTRG